MGFRVSWIAREGISTSELLEAGNCELTDEVHEFTDVGFYLLELPKAKVLRVVLIADGSENYSDLDEQLAKALSKGSTEILYFWCSDTVMCSELICYNAEKIEWAIRYNGYDGGELPLIEGKPPALVNEILSALKAEQIENSNDADYIYELTAEVGRKLVGYRHDMGAVTDEPNPFRLLTRSLDWVAVGNGAS